MEDERVAVGPGLVPGARAPALVAQDAGELALDGALGPQRPRPTHRPVAEGVVVAVQPHDGLHVPRPRPSPAIGAVEPRYLIPRHLERPARQAGDVAELVVEPADAPQDREVVAVGGHELHAVGEQVAHEPALAVERVGAHVADPADAELGAAEPHRAVTDADVRHRRAVARPHRPRQPPLAARHAVGELIDVVAVVPFVAVVCLPIKVGDEIDLLAALDAADLARIRGNDRGHRATLTRRRGWPR